MSTNSKKTVVVGTVRKPHGIKGALKIQAYTDNADRFAKHRRFLIDGREFKVEMLQATPDGWLLKLKGLEDPETAGKFRGKALMLEREKLGVEGPLIEDYLGLSVLHPQGQPMGFVTAFINGGTSGLFEVNTPDGTRMVPVSLEYWELPDALKGTVTLKPEGVVLLGIH